MRAAWLLLLIPLAGCLGGSPNAIEPSCNEQPCHTSWPEALVGPFEFGGLEHVMLTMKDGGQIEGWVGRPAIPGDVPVPTILHFSPYLGGVDANENAIAPATPADESYWHDGDPSGVQPGEPSHSILGFHVQDAWSAGYAVAVFSVRGTGGSSGCLSMNGDQEIHDAGEILEWISTRSWSNGNVGAHGFSYPGGTSLEAGLSGHPALKTIVAGGPNIDLSQWGATPQGLQRTQEQGILRAFALSLAATPQRSIEDGAPPVTDPIGLLCEDINEAAAREDVFPITGERPAEFLLERARIPQLTAINAPILLHVGLYDLSEGAHTHDEVGQFLPPNSHLLRGPWDHGSPGSEPITYLDATCSSQSTIPDRSVWRDAVLAWHDHWLKEVPSLPAAGPYPLSPNRADFFDGCGNFHESSSWPPVANREALFLGDGKLSSVPGTDSQVFVGAVSPANDFQPPGYAGGMDPSSETGYPGWLAWCQSDALPTSVAYVGDPVVERTLIAGNGFAYLNVSSNLASGSFQVHVLAVPAETLCIDPLEATPRMLTNGGADLRFHTGSLREQAWPANQPGMVRVDFWGMARWLEEGERLGVVVSSGDDSLLDRSYSRGNVADAALLTLHPGSHIVMPVLDGALGGGNPLDEYPARPILGFDVQ